MWRSAAALRWWRRSARQLPSWMGPSSVPSTEPVSGSFQRGAYTAAQTGWQGRIPSAGAASLTTCAAPAASTHGGRAKSGSSSGRSGGSGGGNSPASAPAAASQLSPLQRCLQRHGLPQLAFWDGKHTELAEELVQSNLEPKLAALEAEGVGPEALARFLRNAPHSPIPCAAPPFLARLAALRQLLRHISPERLAASPGWSGGMGAAGLLVGRSPGCLAQFLSGGSLGEAAGGLPAMAAWFQQELGISEEQLASMVFARPCLLNAEAGPNLLGVLRALDALSGRPGWGRQLIEQDPVVATGRLPTVQATLEALLGAGYASEEVCAALERQPNLLALEAGGDSFRRKYEWIRAESGWELADFAREPRYLYADLRRAGARLAFMHQQGLQPPPGPDRLVVLSTDSAFCAGMSEQLRREFGVDEWRAWVAGWQRSEAGRRWG